MANSTHATELIAALVAEDRAIATLVAETAEHTAQIDQWLVPALDLRRIQRDCLRHKVERRSNEASQTAVLADRIAGLERELGDARREVRALRESLSWRATGPLRTIYGALSPLWRLMRG
jgi:hypothetical protein